MKNKRNRVDITIGGEDYSKYLCLPFVLQDTGTEQLDSAIIELRGMPIDTKFRPFLEVSLCGGAYNYVVADDTVTEVYGRGLYNHEMTLIDATKMTERILMEAKNFTQPLNRKMGEPQNIEIYCYEDSPIDYFDEMHTALDNQYYKSPVFVPVDDIHKNNLEIIAIDKIGAYFGYDSLQALQNFTWTIAVYFNKTQPAISPTVDSSVFEEVKTPTQINNVTANFVFDANKGSGIYTIRYHGTLGSASTDFIVPLSVYDKNDAEVDDGVYSIVDVLEILLETAIPLFGDDKAEYQLDLTPEQQERWSLIESPEFHFANGRSLYENLKEVGDYIHALPKAKIEDGAKKIYFQELGKRTRAEFNGIPYGSKQQFSAADYANAVEANFENLINATDENDGSVTEPYRGGYITLRSDNYRIKEEDSYIPTAFPIGSKIKSVKVSGLVGIKELLGSTEYDTTLFDKEYDITPAVFEQNEYALLSSFSGTFPFSQTFALYYKTGERNINGLWYRVEDNPLEILNNFQRYAITNVLNYFAEKDFQSYDYKQLKFQITYIPFINGRARQERTEFLGGDRMVLTHNQSANQLSASAFGESLRGKVAMLANPSGSKQYLFGSLEDVPKAGEMFDKKDFISLVTTRVFPDFCVSQIDLSENYNNTGAYAQMKTGIRQYEIPEGETRCTLVEEFCEISDNADMPQPDTLCQAKMKKATVGVFDVSRKMDDISISRIITSDEDNNTIAKNIALPVYSAAVGNSVYFGFKFDDNYKAGARSIDIGIKNARGTQYVEYSSPIQARAKQLDFYLYGTVKEEYVPQNTPYTLPSTDATMWNESDTTPYISTQNTGKLKWNKDSADSASIAYQLHFCSNDGYIITSELAKMMPYIRSSSYWKDKYYVYYYSGEIDEVTGTPNGEHLSTGYLTVDQENLCLRLTKPDNPSIKYKSFIIARQGEQNNPKCIIGKNTDKAPQEIYFNFKRKRG